jgi:tRNA U34 5-methylaminomethyl-2-thiouridine-forming methyltransferase MnmC
MEGKDSYPLSLLVTGDNSQTLYSTRFNATYHSTHGAVSESKHVFIQNGLQYVHEQLNLKSINILEIGFGTGLNAFMTYLYARQHAVKIHYHGIEAYPVPMEAALKLNYTVDFTEHENRLFEHLHVQPWNEVGEVSGFFSFTKHLCSVEKFMCDDKFDVIYFDAFSPSEQPELWTTEIFKKMFALLADKGIFVTYCAQGQMKRNMKSVGFKVKALPGFGGKREMTRAEKV